MMHQAAPLPAGTADAERVCAAVLETDPCHPGALLALARLLMARGDHARASLLLMRCCGVAAENGEAWEALGVALLECDDAVAALAAFSAAENLLPRSHRLALRRVAAALAADTAETELARLDAAVHADPDPVLLTARGALLHRLGRLDEAHDSLDAATALAPEDVVPAIELANLMTHLPLPREAEAAMRRAIALAPEQKLLRSNRAVILMRLHRYREAREELEALVAEGVVEQGVLCNLSNALTFSGLQDEAVAVADRAIAADPTAHLAWRSKVNALVYRAGTEAAEVLDCARNASACLPRDLAPLPPRPPLPERRLRLGLLSPHLRTHPVGWLTVAGIEGLDPRGFELVCFGPAPTGDPIERRFRAVAADWHAIEGVSPADLAMRMRAAGLDILLECSGYGDRGLMAVCAQRVAPVQVKWVGNQNASTGLAEMDWIVTDRWETPPGFEHFYSERLLRLPDGYVCYSVPPYAPEVAPLPALARGHVTFGCFNNLAKITPAVVALWARVLEAVPGARLVLLTQQFDDAGTAARTRADFVCAGADTTRIDLRGSAQHRALLSQYADIDIVLDPFPYGGGLTTCEALWMGVPAVTMPGTTFASRHTVSHLSNVGLTDWIAADPDGYVALAAGKARDLGVLAELRAGLRACMRRSPLCDAPRFGESLGRALRHAWREWCARVTR